MSTMPMIAEFTDLYSAIQMEVMAKNFRQNGAADGLLSAYYLAQDYLRGVINVADIAAVKKDIIAQIEEMTALGELVSYEAQLKLDGSIFVLQRAQKLVKSIDARTMLGLEPEPYLQKLLPAPVGRRGLPAVIWPPSPT